MNKKQFINLFACFIDKYSMEIYKERKKEDKIYLKARQVHYALQDFIREFENCDKKDEYYDFFFENIVVSDSNSQELINKYINNDKKGE